MTAISEGEDTAASAPADDTQPAAWRLGGYAVAGGLVISALVHVALFGTALLVSPRLLHPEPARPVTVDLVTPEELAAMAEKGAPHEGADEPAQKSPDPPVQAPQPQPQLQASASAQSAPSPIAPPAQPIAPPAATDATPLAALSAPSVPAPPSSAPSSGPAAQLAQLLGLPPSVAGLNGGRPSDDKANLTADEIAAFAAHVQSCWKTPAGLAAGGKLQVIIRVSLRRDGSLMTDPVLLAAPASAQGPALVLNAMQTLQRCQPYNVLPAAKYDEWRLLDLHFSAGGLSTASEVPSAQRTPARPG